MTTDKLKQMIRILGKGGSISPSDRQTLERVASELHISDEELQQIIDEELKAIATSQTVVPVSAPSRPSISIKLSSKRVENTNTLNPRTDELSMTSNNPQSQQQSTEQPQQPIEQQPSAEKSQQPTEQPQQPIEQPQQQSTEQSQLQSTVQQTSQTDVQQTAQTKANTTSTGEDDDKDKKMRRMKVMLIIAGVLLLGLLLFLIIDRNRVNDNDDGNGGSTHDSTVNNNPVADTTRDSNPVADAPHDSNPVADTSAVNNGGGNNTTPPQQHTVLDVDRYAAKLLEKQGDRCKANNEFEKARTLYDSAYRKDPDNRDIKRKLDECDELLRNR